MTFSDPAGLCRLGEPEVNSQALFLSNVGSNIYYLYAVAVKIVENATFSVFDQHLQIVVSHCIVIFHSLMKTCR